MAQGTSQKVIEGQLTRHEEILTYMMSSQEEAHNTQVRIQGKLELNLDRFGALENASAG